MSAKDEAMAQIKAGDRVRCVDANHTGALVLGAEYHVLELTHAIVRLREKPHYNFLPGRFKPVVRVKATCVPSLDLLVKRAVAAFDAMTSEQKDAHMKAQSESWVRGQTGWD